MTKKEFNSGHRLELQIHTCPHCLIRGHNTITIMRTINRSRRGPFARRRAKCRSNSTEGFNRVGLTGGGIGPRLYNRLRWTQGSDWWNMFVTDIWTLTFDLTSFLNCDFRNGWWICFDRYLVWILKVVQSGNSLKKDAFATKCGLTTD